MQFKDTHEPRWNLAFSSTGSINVKADNISSKTAMFLWKDLSEKASNMADRTQPVPFKYIYIEVALLLIHSMKWSFLSALNWNLSGLIKKNLLVWTEISLGWSREILWFKLNFFWIGPEKFYGLIWNFSGLIQRNSLVCIELVL